MSRVRVHDFLDPALGKAIPYGVDDLAADEGWVPVGIDHDTAQLAVASIRGWWEHLGGERYPQATSLTITADCGGSNGSRARLWKTELKRLADETGLEIRSSISPRYEQVEQDRASPVQFHQPELARQAADQPPGHHQPDRPASTRAGLQVYARPDDRQYPRDVKVTDAELAAVNLFGDHFHPEWNYTIKLHR